MKNKLKNRLILNFFNLYKWPLGIIFTLSLFSSVFVLVLPYFSKLFIDLAFMNKDLNKFFNLSIWGAAIFIFSTLFKLAEDIIKNRLSVKLKIGLSNRFLKKFYALDLYFFHSKSIGENIYRFSDSRVIMDFLLEQCPQILTDICKFVIILAIAFWMNAKLTFFLVILSPLFLLHRIYIQKRMKLIYEQIWKFSAKLNKEIYEAFSRILVIKALGLEAHQRRNYLKSLLENVRLEIKGFKWGVVSSLGSSFLSKAIYGAITLYGGWLVIKGDLSIGSYTAVMIYLTQLGGIVESFGSRFEYLTREMVSLERFLEVIESEPKIRNSPQAKSIGNIESEICFENVWFGYEEDKMILKNLNFKIPAFSWTGIAGLSGCGKTTLVNLILRLYDPSRGRILIDGHDLKMITLDSLRGKIAIATQQPLLFDLSIRENITYGLKNIDQNKVEEVSRIVCIDDFVNQLSLGYDTIIGEDAFRLSQGFKQRVAIARAILRNPQLLILDEAASSVDFLTEEKIFKNLKNFRKGKTTLIISHRLLSIKDTDKIFFLKQEGQIEEGSHFELLAGSQAYGDFFRNQTENT